MPKTVNLEPVYTNIYERAKMDREFRAKDVVRTFEKLKRSEQSDMFDYMNMLHLSLMGAMGAMNQGDRGQSLNDLSAHFAAQLEALKAVKKKEKWEAEFVCAICGGEVVVAEAPDQQQVIQGVLMDVSHVDEDGEVDVKSNNDHAPVIEQED